jgi:glycosyltransferase involved in cell wall biosynthesis
MEKDNRILILSGVFPPDIGGPTTFLDPLAKELIKNGYAVRVLTFGRSEAKYPYPVNKVSKAWPGPLRSFIFLKKGLWFGLWSDIIYNQDLYTAGLTALVIKKVLRKKLVTRFVGDSAWEKSSVERLVNDDVMTFQEKKYSFKIEWRKKIRKKILTNSDKIIVASNFLKQVALKIGLPKEKIKVIYNSIDFLKMEPSLSEREALRKKMGLEGKILLTIARLTPWKGVDMLIELMPDLVRRYGQIKLVVVGQGPELKNLKRLTQELKIENNIYFAGKANRQQVNDYLFASDLFLLNTNYEGMSHLLLEAMKAGVPIITTPVGGNPETIKDGRTGLLVEYWNKKKWLEAIDRILNSPALAEELIKNARDNSKRFSWDNLVRETIEVFNNLTT